MLYEAYLLDRHERKQLVSLSIRAHDDTLSLSPSSVSSVAAQLEQRSTSQVMSLLAAKLLAVLP